MTNRNDWKRGLLTLWIATGFWTISACANPQVEVEQPWVRATVPGQTVGAAYMTLNSRQAATLVKIESPAADFVEIHKMSMKDGVMEMRMLDKLPLPAGEAVKLEPGGFHLMLIDLKRSLKVGETVPLLLNVQDADGKTLTLEVIAPIKGR